jgi:plasmid stabilization system protein ParE
MKNYNIVWTKFALASLEFIYTYYKLKTSKNIADKIVNNILNTVEDLKLFPEIGVEEELLKGLKFKYRYLLSDKNKIIYTLKDESVIITDVFDVRQNPKKLVRRNKIRKRIK